MTTPKHADTDIFAHAFFLADHASVESGKAYINGGFWNRLSFPAFPAAAFFSVVAILHVPWHAYNTPHKFAVSIEDADGNPLPAKFEGDFHVVAAPEMRVGDPTIMPIAAVVNGLPFSRPGDYALVLHVDDAEISRWPLRVTLIAPPAAPGGPASIRPIPT